jgi:DNA-binding XRE family transcriptional regulator
MMSKNLKVLREAKGITQTETAQCLGISLHSYCNKENGKVDFTMSEAKKLSDLFGLTIDEIFFKQLDFKVNTETSA